MWNCDEMVLFIGQLPLNVFPQIPASACVIVLTSLVRQIPQLCCFTCWYCLTFPLNEWGSKTVLTAPPSPFSSISNDFQCGSKGLIWVRHSQFRAEFTWHNLWLQGNYSNYWVTFHHNKLFNCFSDLLLPYWIFIGYYHHTDFLPITFLTLTSKEMRYESKEFYLLSALDTVFRVVFSHMLLSTFIYIYIYIVYLWLSI